MAKYYIEMFIKNQGLNCFPCIDYEKTFSGFIFYHQKDDKKVEAEIYNFTDITKIEIEKIEESENG